MTFPAATTGSHEENNTLMKTLSPIHVHAHIGAAAQAGHVSADRAEDGVPHPRDHDPVPVHLAAAVQTGLLSAEQVK